MDDSCNDIAEAVAVKGDKIIAVGKHDDVFRLVGAATQVIYLKKNSPARFHIIICISQLFCKLLYGRLT